MLYFILYVSADTRKMLLYQDVNQHLSEFGCDGWASPQAALGWLVT